MCGGASSLQYFKADKELAEYKTGRDAESGITWIREVKSATKFCSQKIHPADLETLLTLFTLCLRQVA